MMTWPKCEATIALEQIERLKNIRVSSREAASLLGIPDSTLRNRVDQIKPDENGQYGLFDLADWLIDRSGRQRIPGIREDIVESLKLEERVYELEMRLKHQES